MAKKRFLTGTLALALGLVVLAGLTFTACDDPSMYHGSFSSDDDDNGGSTVSVTSVTLNPTSLSLTVNGTRTLTATVSPSNATNKSLTWSSSNTSVATVNNSGVVTAKAAGTATITVTTTDGGKKATCVVTVTASSSGSFNGTTLASTQWVGESELDLSFFEMGKGTAKGTLAFSSNTVGTIKAEIKDWGTITDLGKAMVNSMLGTGTFTLSDVTYNATSKTGTYTYTIGAGTNIATTYIATFTVDVSAKKLTSVEIPDGKEDEAQTIVYSLQ